VPGVAAFAARSGCEIFQVVGGAGRVVTMHDGRLTDSAIGWGRDPQPVV
jgi:hypothetical protein